MQKYFLLFTSLLLIHFHLHSQSGTLDPTFGVGGRVKTNITNGSLLNTEQAVATAVQSDGKILVVARSIINMVARYNTDGTLDNTFDQDGLNGLYNFQPTSIAVGSDGKIVVGGYSNNGLNTDCAVIRLNSDGSFDYTFDGDSRAVTSASLIAADQFNAVAVQPDGKIVAAGFTLNGLNNDWLIVRYNTNGTLDNTFDGDGKQTTSFGAGEDIARAIAIQSDGKIVVAGNGLVVTQDCAVARFNTDGSPDNTFDGDGKVTTSTTILSEELTSIAIQTDGKIVVGGNAITGLYYDDILIRYNTNGSLDGTFNFTGIVTAGIGTQNDYLNSLALQTDGKIVVAGYYNNGIVNDSYTARFTTSGSFDATYDGDGKRPIALSAADDQYVGVAIYGGKIISLGYGLIGGGSHYVVNRNNSDGSLDNTFNGSGQVTSAGLGGSNDMVNAITAQADGKVIVVGTTTATNADWVVARYNNDGTFDNTFDSDGRLTTALSLGLDNAQAVAVQTDGKIVVAGSTTNGLVTHFALVRYNTNGTLDNTFDGDGIQTTPVGSTSAQINAIVIQPDGKIVVAGYGTTLGNAEFALARYNTNGSLDASFDGDGIQLTPVSLGTDVATSIALQNNGKIVAAGYSDLGFSTVRYNTDGSLDVTFDNDGIQTTALASGADKARSVAIQADGKIVVAGVAYPASGVFGVVRYNGTDGSLDNTFDSDGILTTVVGPIDDAANSVSIQTDGKIVVTGYAENSFLNYDFAVARYNTNGTLDNTFGAGGIGIYDLYTGATDQATAAKLVTNRIYAAGLVISETGQDLALAAISVVATPLPLELLSFAGNLNNGDAHLIWETTNERNTREFDIERSQDGITYTKAGTVQAVNNPGNHTYTFTDAAVGTPDVKKLYYRLKQKDVDGQFTYSGVVTLTPAGNGTMVRLYPNPVEATANLLVTAAAREAITYLIIDSKGSIVRTVKTALEPGSNRITINTADLKAGVYTLDVRGVVTNEQLRFLKR